MIISKPLAVQLIGFSKPERQMLNSIFLLSAAGGRPVAYHVCDSAVGEEASLLLVDGDSDTAIAGWKSGHSDKAKMTVVAGSRYVDIGFQHVPKPLSLKLVGVMDKLVVAMQQPAVKRVLILRHGPGASTRGRKWARRHYPEAKVHVHDVERHGVPPQHFRWDLVSVVLVEDRYARREGLLWLSELRARRGFPRIERFPSPALPATLPESRTRSPEIAALTKSMIEQRDARNADAAAKLIASTGIQGFRPISVIGEGATSTVCLCERIAGGEKIALKILKTEGSADMELLPRFVQEYMSASLIDSPHVAKVFEHGFTDSHAFIAMEYFQAGDLRSRLQVDRMVEEEAVMLMAGVLGALNAVHSAGIVHRDLKPAHIMFRDDGTLVLTDFGSALIQENAIMDTHAGVVIGTPYYLSPEQAAGGTADCRSDLYSVGALFHELLTGEKLFSADTVDQLFDLHQSHPTPHLPLHLFRYQEFLDRLTAKEPSQRFQTADEALQALMIIATDAEDQSEHVYVA